MHSVITKIVIVQKSVVMYTGKVPMQSADIISELPNLTHLLLLTLYFIHYDSVSLMWILMNYELDRKGKGAFYS